MPITSYMLKLGVILLLSVFFTTPSYGGSSAAPLTYEFAPEELTCDFRDAKKPGSRIRNNSDCTTTVVTLNCTYKTCNGKDISETCVPSVEVEPDFACEDAKIAKEEAERKRQEEAARARQAALQRQRAAAGAQAKSDAQAKAAARNAKASETQNKRNETQVKPPDLASALGTGSGADTTGAGGQKSKAATDLEARANQKIAQDQANQRRIEEQERQRSEALARRDQEEKRRIAASSGTPEEIREQLKQVNERAEQRRVASEACSTAMSATNGSCAGAVNGVSFSLPNTGGAREGFEAVKGTCQQAEQDYQTASGSCGSAIASCNNACQETGRSCGAMSSYTTIASVKQDSAQFCRKGAEASIRKILGQPTQSGDEDFFTATDGSPLTSVTFGSGIFGTDGSLSSDGGSVSGNSEKDLKKEMNKISTGSVDGGGSFGQGLGSGSFGRRSRGGKSEGSASGFSGKVNTAGGSTLSARELLQRRMDNLRRRGLASEEIYGNRKYNMSHDVFMGGTRGMWLWQEKHGGFDSRATPLFFYNDNPGIFGE